MYINMCLWKGGRGFRGPGLGSSHFNFTNFFIVVKILREDLLSYRSLWKVEWKVSVALKL